MSVPDTLTLEKHRDLQGIGNAGIWLHRAFIALLTALAVIALVNFFGQRSVASSTASPAAILYVRAPTALRGGLLTQDEFRVTARTAIKDAWLVLDSGWVAGTNVNSIEPQPSQETSKGGRLALQLGAIPAGRSFTLYLQLQVNPTTVSWQRPQAVSVFDGDRLLVTMNRSLRIFP